MKVTAITASPAESCLCPTQCRILDKLISIDRAARAPNGDAARCNDSGAEYRQCHPSIAGRVRTIAPTRGFGRPPHARYRMTSRYQVLCDRTKYPRQERTADIVDHEGVGAHRRDRQDGPIELTDRARPVSGFPAAGSRGGYPHPSRTEHGPRRTRSRGRPSQHRPTHFRHGSHR
jgi:hypothetical protein